MDAKVKKTINYLIKNIKQNKYKGYDPYDCLNSPLFQKISSKWIQLLCTQMFVYSPLNFRKFVHISPQINPKAMGLLLSSFIQFQQSKTPISTLEIEKEIHLIYDWLINNANTKYSGKCWGYPFPWQDLHKYIPQYEPSIVCTSFIGHALLDYYDYNKDKNTLPEIESICAFITNDLHTNKDIDGICFSYSPHDTNIVHNANLLGASFLARAGKALGNNSILKTAKTSYHFSLPKQNPDGSWHYSIDIHSDTHRIQNDFHQGYIIDSLIDYAQYIKDDSNIQQRITQAASFYTKQFSENGKSYWRYPTKWPIDIHNQAQGIITFSRLSTYLEDEKYSQRARKILHWTINNMQEESGYFYYQKWPFITNKTNYLRWSQIWMIKAISEDTIQTQLGKNNE